MSAMITLHGRWIEGGYIFVHYSCVGALVHAWHIVEWACVKCILLFYSGMINIICTVTVSAIIPVVYIDSHSYFPLDWTPFTPSIPSLFSPCPL